MRAVGFIGAFTVLSIVFFGLCHIMFRVPFPDPPIAVMEVITLIGVGSGVCYGKTDLYKPNPQQ